MRKALITLLVVVFSAGLMLAQEKKDKSKEGYRKISGDIVSMDEANSTITITKGNEKTTVHYNDKTKWTKQEGDKVVDAARSDFKTHANVVCQVKADDQGRLWARRIELRPTKSVPK
jgi:hypothetical protein